MKMKFHPFLTNLGANVLVLSGFVVATVFSLEGRAEESQDHTLTLPADHHYHEIVQQDLKEKKRARICLEKIEFLENWLTHQTFAEGWVVGSRKFSVQNNFTREFAEEASEILEQLYVDLLKTFGMSDRRGSSKKIPVKIFRNMSEFQAYGNAPEGALGYFNNNTDGEIELVLFVSTSLQQTRTILLHEGTHLIENIGQVSRERGMGTGTDIWLAEGVASYYEASQWEDGKLMTGKINFTRLKEFRDAIEAGTAISMDELLKIPQHKFDSIHYAHAWGFLHFLMHGPSHRQTSRQFGQFYKKQLQGRREPDLFEKTFRKTAGSFDEELHKYILTLDWEEQYNPIAEHEASLISSCMGRYEECRKRMAAALKGQEHLKDFLKAQNEARQITTLLENWDPNDFESARSRLIEAELRLDILGLQIDVNNSVFPLGFVVLADTLSGCRDILELIAISQTTFLPETKKKAHQVAGEILGLFEANQEYLEKCVNTK